MRIRRPSPAMGVALLALFVALGGTGYAALSLPANSVGPRQLKNGAVTLRKISRSTRRSLKGATGSRGPQGPAGPSTGPAGGALQGSYPNPTLAAGAVSPANLSGVPAARLTNTSDQSWPDQLVVTPIPFDKVVYDTAGMHTAPTRLTAPIPGVYLIGATVLFGNASTTLSRSLNLIKDGTSTLTRTYDDFTGNDSFQPVTAVTTAKLVAGDYVEAEASRSGGGASVKLTALGPEFAPSFWMTWIAP